MNPAGTIVISREFDSANRVAALVSRRLGLVLAAALVVRLVPILAADRVVADVLRYEKAARHVLDVSWNPYLAPRL